MSRATNYADVQSAGGLARILSNAAQAFPLVTSSNPIARRFFLAARRGCCGRVAWCCIRCGATAGVRRLRLFGQIACGRCSMGDEWVVDPTCSESMLVRSSGFGVDTRGATIGDHRRGAAPQITRTVWNSVPEKPGVGYGDPHEKSRNKSRETGLPTSHGSLSPPP